MLGAPSSQRLRFAHPNNHNPIIDSLNHRTCPIFTQPLAITWLSTDQNSTRGCRLKLQACETILTTQNLISDGFYRKQWREA